MTYSLAVTVDAHTDIDKITDYIAIHLANPSAAIGFLDDAERTYYRITANPFMYSLCRDERLRKKGYRVVVIKNYLLFYRVDEAGRNIYIIRIIYGARDYTSLL